MAEGVGELIDTHAHLTLPAFDADRAIVLERAHASGVGRIVCVGLDAESSAAAVALANSVPGMGASVGMHPHESGRWSPGMAAQLRALAQDHAVVAIGETGIDYARGRHDAQAQHAAFEQQVALAQALGLPVIVHNRDANDDVFEILRNARAEAVVLHCFTGDNAFARRAIDSGWHLGFGGVITYKSGAAVAERLAKLPRDRVVLETDSPYLAPGKRRGNRNEPAYIIASLHELAAAMAMTEEQAAATTTANALVLFPKLAHLTYPSQAGVSLA